ITTVIGRIKNPTNTAVSGATCRYALRRARMGPASPCAAVTREADVALREPDHTAAHACPERATVPHCPGALNLFASGADNIHLRWFPFHPIAPFIVRHVLLGCVQYRRIIPLAVQKGA